MTHPRTTRAGRWFAVAAILASLAAASVAIRLAAPGRWPLVAVIVLALLWGLGSSVAVALTGTEAPPFTGTDAVGERPRIGVVMHLGAVPDEVARTTSAVAAAAGPVALVVPPGRAVPPRLDPSVIVVADDDSDRSPHGTASAPEGTAAAVEALRERCEGVLMLSARALPGPALEQAALLLGDGASWVVGTTEPLNRDRFGPTRRERLDAALRRRLPSAGAWAWEPDATVVRTSLLAEHPPEPGVPMGSWLRQRAASGLTGATLDAPIARRAAPVAAEGYWPDTTARQRAAAADLCDASASSMLSARARLATGGLAVRALSGWSVALWLTALVLLADGSPVRSGTRALAALLGAALVLRWLAPRVATRTRPSPTKDLLAAVYALPGSLAATASALTRRVRPARRPFPTRPLVWLAMVATAAASSVMLTAAPGDGAARVAAGVSAVLLVMLWVFTVRALIERSWQRVGFRIPLDLPAFLEGAGTGGTGDADGAGSDAASWRLVDGSPGGFALQGAITGLGRGDEITVRVPRSEHAADQYGAALELEGTVAGKRRGANGCEVLGVELRSVHPGTASWGAVLLEGASRVPTTDVPVVDEHGDEQRWARATDRLAIGLAVAISLAVVTVVTLVLVGIQPLIIRSGSMEPTYSVGDVVVVTPQRAGEVEPGEVVTRFDAPDAPDSLTHRVVEVLRDGDMVQITTRGDANDSSERWSTPTDRTLGVVVASVPAVGTPLSTVRSPAVGSAVVALAVLAMAALMVWPKRRGRSGTPRVEGSLTRSDGLPTETAPSTTGDRP